VCAFAGRNSGAAVIHGQTLTLADIDTLDFSKTPGLLPAIVQDADSGAVLMLGYMNATALRATLERGRVVFFSRSKERLWEKGETSGQHLELVALRTDCDRDCVLVSARAQGLVCHLKTRSCFGDAATTAAERLAFLAELEAVIESRSIEPSTDSYTARLLAQGGTRIAQKVGEEALELALAAVAESDDKVVAESADLIFHMLVLLRSRGLSLASVIADLATRRSAEF
jgi:phosphoribosyl-ATP pyrophosphohydrolase/phosphoribosyl-AMP cyclohydrolase